MIRLLTASCLLFILAAGPSTAVQLLPPDQRPALTDEQREQLNRGEPVRIASTGRHEDGRIYGKGTVYIRIDVAPDDLFNYILDFDHYKDFYPNLIECRVYERDGNTYYVLFDISMIGVLRVRNHYRRVYHPEQQLMTFTLDERFENDYRETSGYWKAWPGPDGMTILEYTMYAETNSSMPATVQKIATGYALKQVSLCMKKRAESGGTYIR